VWYHGNDLNLLFWQRTRDQVIGVELDRSRLLADVLATLAPGVGEHRTVELVDAAGVVLHRWAAEEEPATWPVVSRLDLTAPLSAWQLRARALPGALDPGPLGGSGALGVLAGLLALALALVGAALVFYREHTRSHREAQQRVTFVNQVSHELKTPLTNIRLYAELLQGELPEEETHAQSHLQVVVSESERLGRLIDNVLTLSRQQRGALSLHPVRQPVDAVVERVAQAFRPLLQARGMRLQVQGGAPHPVWLDGDALAQILANLLSNAEKYAAAGGWVEIQVEAGPGWTRLRIQDRGPGIPPRDREAVFEPFVRLSDGVTDGATGTGIGLTIARALARAHGGDLRILDAPAGTAFELTLSTPAEEAGDPGAGKPDGEAK
jgi:signal transduction histidine kinase